MTNNFSRKAHLLLNIALVIVAVWLCAVIIKYYSSHRTSNVQAVSQQHSDAGPVIVDAAAESSSAGATQDSARKESEEIITNAELTRMIESGQRVVILDVREREAYAQEHIAGARNIPIDELDVRASNELSSSDLIVAYCRCPDNALSRIARKFLNEQGFHHILLLREDSK